MHSESGAALSMEFTKSSDSTESVFVFWTRCDSMAFSQVAYDVAVWV